MSRFEIVAAGRTVDYQTDERCARQLCDLYSVASANRCAHIYDRHCTMIVYRSRAGRCEMDLSVPVARV